MITFPIDRASKRPIVKWGALSGAVPVPEGCDTGLATGNGLVVLDLDWDPAKGLDGAAALARARGLYVNGHQNAEALAELIRAEVLPETKITRTRRGGYHVHLSTTQRVKNSVGRLAQGVDVRGDGGYVKVPPSEGYELVIDRPLAVAPAWLLDALREPQWFLSETGAREPAWTRAGEASGPSAEEARHALANAAWVLSQATEGGNALLLKQARLLGGYVGSRAIGEREVRAALEGAIASWDDQERHLDTLERALENGKESPIRVVTETSSILSAAHDLAAPEPPIDWLCPGLRLAAGPPAILAGFGWSGKTMLAQDLAVAVASGGELLEMPCRQGAVLHLDWDQGGSLSRRRYQRMAKARGLDIAELPIVFKTPDRFLDDPEVLQALAREAQGYALVIIDSFLMACSKIDENDAGDVRGVLQPLMRISEASGATILLIHHARKPSGENEQARFSLRGSSAIHAGASTVIVANGVKGQPSKLECVKEKLSGSPFDDMHFQPVDTDDGGLRLDPVGAEAAILSEIRNEILDDEAVRMRIIVHVRANPGCACNDVARILKVRKATVLSAIKMLVAQGAIQELEIGNRKELWAPKPVNPPSLIEIAPLVGASA